jgi:clan AA aspartic protease
MIHGVVNAQHEATVRVRVRGPSGIESDVKAIVDSGFTASLALPVDVVNALGLPRQSGGKAILADGSVRYFDICAAELAWGMGWRPVFVYAVGDEPLLGMRLLAGHRVVMDVVPGGLVEIVPLP